MKKSKKVFSLVSLIISSFVLLLFSLTSCDKSSNDIDETISKSVESSTIESTATSLSSEAKIISSGDIVFDGFVGNDIVSNSTTSYSFKNIIEVSSGAKWILCSNEFGLNVIVDKFIPLNEGDNTYYIIVTSENGENVEVYTITIRRRPMYSVTFNTNGGTAVEALSVEEGNEIENLSKTTKAGYTLDGWYIGDEKIELPYTVVSNIELEAKFVANKYTVTIDPQGYNYTGETSYEVTYGEQFQFPVASVSLVDKVYTTTTDFKGWKYNGEYITDSNGNLLKDWNIPSSITITPEIVVDGMYFGRYPQTKVEATSSNGLSAITFNSTTWTDYGYYISGSVSSYMYYLDVDTDNNGDYDYRGVYFTSYRPYYTTNSSSASNSYQDDNGYNRNTIYWFAYEPIKWNVLETKDGKALILADLILDSQEYQHYTSSGSQFSHNGGTGYANNYALSHIRQWLNDTFYETAFNDLEKAIIETTEVDNSPTSTGHSSNSYACENTNDKIFLLSYQEVTTYFTSDASRQAKTTDYAQAQGAYTSTSSSYLGNGYVWLRSPYDDVGGGAYYVYYYGVIEYIGVFYTDCGVRAVCWINL